MKVYKPYIDIFADILQLVYPKPIDELYPGVIQAFPSKLNDHATTMHPPRFLSLAKEIAPTNTLPELASRTCKFEDFAHVAKFSSTLPSNIVDKWWTIDEQKPESI